MVASACGRGSSDLDCHVQEHVVVGGNTVEPSAAEMFDAKVIEW